MTRHRHVLSLRENPTCILCPETPPCACDPDEVCVIISRTCDSCGSNQCLPRSEPVAPPPAPGVSTGAVAGAVVASVLAFALALALYLWYRRRWQRQLSPVKVVDEKTEVPARAEDVLRRPDPNARAPVLNSPDMPTFRVFPESSSSLAPANATASSYAATHGHGRAPWGQYPAFSGVNSDHRLSAGTHPHLISATFTPGAPSLAGIDAAQDTPHSLPPMPPLRPSTRSRIPSPEPNSSRPDRLDVRSSYNTETSLSTELSSIPIVEPSHGTVKHVMGVARAEVIRTPKPSLSSVHPSLHLNRLSGTKSTIGVTSSERPPPLPTSRLSNTGFGAIPVPDEERSRDDPFRDRRTPSPVPPRSDIAGPSNRRSVTPSMATFGDTGEQRWPQVRASRLPWARRHDSSRPNSGATSHATVSTPSTRSSFGLRWSKASSAAGGAPPALAPPLPTDVPYTPALAPPLPTDVPYTPASCSGESPRSAAFPAPAHRDTLTVPTALEQSGGDALHSSRASVLSAASSLSESILSAFPFVPPSPIGSVHTGIRTPPRSPLVQTTFPRDERRDSGATGADVPSSSLAVDVARTASATPSSRGSSTPPPSSSGTRRSSLTDSPKPLFLNRKVDRSRLSIDRDAPSSS